MEKTRLLSSGNKNLGTCIARKIKTLPFSIFKCKSCELLEDSSTQASSTGIFVSNETSDSSTANVNNNYY